MTSANLDQILRLDLDQYVHMEMGKIMSLFERGSNERGDDVDGRQLVISSVEWGPYNESHREGVGPRAVGYGLTRRSDPEFFPCILNVFDDP